MTAKLHMERVTKTFPGVTALDNVSITVRAGEVLGLVGVNGAGKSSLMNVLGGIYVPDSGKIEIDGQAVTLNRPIDADRSGISFIHQELLYFPTLTVAENMFISHLPTSGPIPYRVDKKTMRERAREALDQLGSDIRPTAPMEELSVGEKQVVEIARAIAMGSDIVIFDEPSSSLSIKEKEALFAIVRRLRNERKAIIYISHFLDEIEILCDSYVVLRNGKLVAEGRVADVTRDQIVEMVVGEAIGDSVRRGRRKGDQPALTIRDLRRGEILRGVNFDIRSGEVLGLWGLMGSGRTELIRSILGLDPMDSGTLTLHDGAKPGEIPPSELLSNVAYVTESRRVDGLFLDEPVWKNVTATTLWNFVRGPLRILQRNAEETASRKLIDRLRIITPDHRTRSENLSGGNQQKVIFAKWMSRRPRILILDEPTRGVDVGAKREIGDLVGSMADEGTAVLLVTSEIEEMVTMADRVLVLREGQFDAEILGENITEANLMAAAIGKESGNA